MTGLDVCLKRSGFPVPEGSGRSASFVVAMFVRLNRDMAIVKRDLENVKREFGNSGEDNAGMCDG